MINYIEFILRKYSSYLAGDYFQVLRNIVAVRQQSSLINMPE